MNRFGVCMWLCLWAAAGSLGAQGHEPVFPQLSGQPLLDALFQTYKPATVLDFARSRDTLFARVDGRNDSLFCVYTGYGIPLDPSQDPTQAAFALGINTEHTWPRALGAEAGNAQADMHHLFATREDVNAARANLPFGDLPDALTQRWYRLGIQQTFVPSSRIDEYSEWRSESPFEPREDHKGNVARAMFYFNAIYPFEVAAAGPGFFAPQRATLCAWHLADPVDEREWQRSWRIAQYQDGKPNPFVLDCTLAFRTFCPEYEQACISSTANVTPTLPLAKVWPNPSANGEVWLAYELAEAGAVSVTWLDAAGRPWPAGSFSRRWHTAGAYQLPLHLPAPGFWLCQLTLLTPDGPATVHLPVVAVR